MNRPYRGLGLSDRTITTMSASLRVSTKKQYLTFIRKWEQYCLDAGTSYKTASISDVLEFLAHLHHDLKMSYSAINTARSALSAYLMPIEQHSVGSHPLVIRLLKGIFNTKPPTPRYTHMWDVSVVLTHLRGWPPVGSLSLEQATYKTLMLMALVSAQRVQSLHQLNLNYMVTTPDTITFTMPGLVKQSRPGTSNSPLIFRAYPPEPRLCVVTHLHHYLDTTQTLRGREKALWVSHRKPFGRVTSQTLSRWLKQVLSMAGINTNVFKSHSTRAASTSAADRMQVPLDHILRAAGWSRESTFQRFYKKPLMEQDVFADTILKTAKL